MNDSGIYPWRRVHFAAQVLASLLAAIWCGFSASVSRSETVSETAEINHFETRVRPLLMGRCYACHSAETKPAGGLRVDDYNGLVRGGESGPAVVPGDAAASEILSRVVTEDESRRMPQDGERLSDEEIADLKRWIEAGAAWPQADDEPADDVEDVAELYDYLRESHWAFRPVARVVAPVVANQGWPQGDVDRFVLAGLESAGLSPVATADRVTWLRRVSFDLTGLLPTEAEIEDFLTDSSENAFEQVVDRLLASRGFGERWGRHWLDVARYGESTGPSRNVPYPHAWRYRDYVIDSVNDDVPIDRFIREQIAGDLIAAASPETVGKERDRLLTATGFLALGVKDVNQRFEERFLLDNVDEQIDVVTRGILGLTVSCARCHDHKFDPIPTADYYALAGIFTSTESSGGLRNQMGGSGLAFYVPENLVRLSIEVPPPDEAEVRRLEEKVRQAREAWQAIRGTPKGLAKRPNGQPVQRQFRVAFDRAREELSALTDPASYGAVVHGASEATSIGDTAIRFRGEAERHGPVVPRGYLTGFDVPGSSPVNRQQSGRLELAAWLTSPANPLTARVAANRIWQNLFGIGLVSSSDNFGLNGASPSHPELLDYLATRLVKSGWSRKALIRQLVLSQTYRLSSATTAEHLELDPDNRLLWRHTPRRLTSEEFRDSVLAAADTLVRDRPEVSLISSLRMVEIRDNGTEAATVLDHSDTSRLRSIYLPLMRGVTPRSLECFDPAEQSLVTVKRDVTTVPSQALFLLNSDFIHQHTARMAEQWAAASWKEDRQRIRQAYLRILSRLPSDREIDQAIDFIRHIDSIESKLASGRVQAGPGIGDQVVTGPGAELRLVSIRTAPRHTATSRSGWQAFCQSLISSAEFRYVR